MRIRVVSRLLAVLSIGYLFFFGCSSWRAAQSPEEGSRLPVMESMPIDSSKIDTVSAPTEAPRDPDTVLPPPKR